MKRKCLIQKLWQEWSHEVFFAAASKTHKGLKSLKTKKPNIAVKSNRTEITPTVNQEKYESRVPKFETNPNVRKPKKKENLTG